jgi:flagellar biosynthesis GTPase FlhF
MPSFATDSPLDIIIKRGLLQDAFKLLCLNVARKQAMKADVEEKIKQRLLKPQRTVALDDKKDENIQARAEEERKQKAIQKKKDKEDKENSRKSKMLARENDEAAEVLRQKNDESAKPEADEKAKMMATKGNLKLIFPLVSYKLDIFIDEHYENEEKLLKEEIETKKKEALDAAGGDAKKMDFDVVRDCYIPDVRKYSFDLDVVKKNQRGDTLPKVPKTDEEL